MTRMLDILQDYLSYKDYNYERLDGSVRGEERYLAIQNFTDPDVFVFILSTKAGGVGLNLVAADTVIFFDSDFNPQNDIQAAARCHRIGQTKPVKIIRFVAQSTVEEIILKRAEAKLKLTDAVIEGGHPSSHSAEDDMFKRTNLLSIIKFGLSKILESEDSTIEDQDIESLIGSSVDSKWVVKDSDNETKVEFIAETQSLLEDEKPPESMYHYEGHDYSKEPSQADISAFDSVLVKADELHRTLRSNKGVTVSELPTATRKRKPLTEEQLEERRRKRIESAAKKAKLQEEQRIKREKKMREKLEETWRSKGYTSLNLPLDSEGESDTDKEENMEEDCLSADTQDIKYVSGDVAMPKTQDGDSIVVHCVDDSGRWGKGGVFSALSTRSAQPEQLYLLAGKMKDLTLGDAHLIAIDDRFSRDNGKDYVAVIVAQKRDRQNQLSPIHLTALSTGFERVATYAKRTNATVHLPRIGYATPKFNWYGTERLIRKHLTARGIPTFIYYYSRKSSKASAIQYVRSPNKPYESEASCSKEELDCSTIEEKSKNETSDFVTEEHIIEDDLLPSFFRDYIFYIGLLADDVKQELKRYIIAYDGDISSRLIENVTHIVCSNHLQPEEISQLKVDNPQASVSKETDFREYIRSLTTKI